jgi:hypothetical protein
MKMKSIYMTTYPSSYDEMALRIAILVPPINKSNNVNLYYNLSDLTLRLDGQSSAELNRPYVRGDQGELCHDIVMSPVFSLI